MIDLSEQALTLLFQPYKSSRLLDMALVSGEIELADHGFIEIVEREFRRSVGFKWFYTESGVRHVRYLVNRVLENYVKIAYTKSYNVHIIRSVSEFLSMATATSGNINEAIIYRYDSSYTDRQLSTDRLKHNLMLHVYMALMRLVENYDTLNQDFYIIDPMILFLSNSRRYISLVEGLEIDIFEHAYFSSMTNFFTSNGPTVDGTSAYELSVWMKLILKDFQKIKHIDAGTMIGEANG